jgi:hypothetical protein
MKFLPILFGTVCMSVFIGSPVLADGGDSVHHENAVYTDADPLVQEKDNTGEKADSEKEISAMNEEQKAREMESNIRNASQYFAASLNGEVWNLLQKSDRSVIEKERMIHAAHASCFHWLVVGTGAHHQRGEWLIARVYTELGLVEPALRHAVRCLELTHEHKDLVKDFDWAYAYEGIARANALAGNSDDATKYRRLAEQHGNLIESEEDKKIFISDFLGGNWHGIK